jgi:hypothetical protein
VPADDVLFLGATGASTREYWRYGKLMGASKAKVETLSLLFGPEEYWQQGIFFLPGL